MEGKLECGGHAAALSRRCSHSRMEGNTEPVKHILGSVADVDRGARATVVVPADSAWFAGHFPGRPVLPGVAMLVMADEIARLRHPGWVLAGLRRVKFRTPVEAGCELAVLLTAMPSGDLGFSISADAIVCCDGLLSRSDRAGEASSGKPPEDPAAGTVVDRDLEDFIPHRRPMRLLDRLVTVAPDECLARGRLQGWVPAILGIEMVAQAAAGLAGWEASLAGRAPGGGFLVGIRSASFPLPALPAGAGVEARVRRLSAKDNYATFSGTVLSDGVPAASTQIQVMTA
jgi:3-hydroxymyristoyl/3-hydroxydecanoyl-(acyl carrier protein) dehydratase